MKTSTLFLLLCFTSITAHAQLNKSFCRITTINGTHTIIYDLQSVTNSLNGTFTSTNTTKANNKIQELNGLGLNCPSISGGRVKTKVVVSKDKKVKEEVKEEVKEDDKKAGVVIDNIAIGGMAQSFEGKGDSGHKKLIALEFSGNDTFLKYDDTGYNLGLYQGSIVIGGSSDGFTAGLKFDTNNSKGLMAGSKSVKVFFGGRYQVNGQLLLNPALPNHLEGSLGVETGLALKINDDFLMKVGPIAQGTFSLMVNEDDYVALQTGGRVELAILDNILISASSASNALSTLKDGEKRQKHQGGIYLQLAGGKLQIGADVTANVINGDRSSVLDLQERIPATEKSRMGLDGGISVKGDW